MGYKLAGFDVLGCNEIDPKMMEAYKANHNPKYAYLEPIQTFKNRKDLPKELYNLDILDGSPPCSSFSMAGNREKDWGKEKVFREGQAEQVLDTLFFDFIDLAKELQPKVVVAENVSGMMMGTAKEYVKKVYEEFKKAGYQLRIQPYLLDASKMGVPQRRRRVFFIALRNDLAPQFMEAVDMFQTAPKLELNFNEKEIKTKDFLEYKDRKKLTNSVQNYYNKRLDTEFCLGETAERLGKRSHFNYMVLNPEKSSYTVTGKENLIFNNGYLTDNELKKIGSYPSDYNFIKNKVTYLVGMSVPPVMVAQIAKEIYNQWLSKINK
tara:strand:- start:227 stop:1192 length:966 start_codon:yes stop_codon:yes gene_type:complete